MRIQVPLQQKGSAPTPSPTPPTGGGGSIGGPVSGDLYGTWPTLYINPTTVSANTYKVSGGACASGPAATAAASSDHKLVKGNMQYSTPQACGGDADGVVTWEERYPLVYVDNVLVNDPH